MISLVISPDRISRKLTGIGMSVPFIFQGGRMRKGYIMKWTRRPEPDSHLDDFTFCEFAKDAAFYTDQTMAQNDCTMLNRGIAVTVPCEHGGKYVIRDFAVEESEPGTWVVYCHAPF